MSPEQPATTPSTPKHGPKDGGTTYLTVGLAFLVIGIALYIGDSAVGLPFSVIGLTFLVIGGGERSKRKKRQDDLPHP